MAPTPEIALSGCKFRQQPLHSLSLFIPFREVVSYGHEMGVDGSHLLKRTTQETKVIEAAQKAGQGTLTLVLNWGAEAAGRTFVASVPLAGLCLDGQETSAVRFCALQDLRLCVARRGVRLTLLEGEAAEDGSPLSLRFSVSIPPESTGGKNKLIALLGQVAIGGIEELTHSTSRLERRISMEGHLPPMVTSESSETSLRLSTAEGKTVACRWHEEIQAALDY